MGGLTPLRYLRGAAHLALVGLVTYHVALYNAATGVTRRQLGQRFASLFTPPDAGAFSGNPTDNPAGERMFLFGPDDVRGAVGLALHRYWALPSFLIAPAEVAVPGGNGTTPGAAAAAPSRSPPPSDAWNVSTSASPL
jgi:hypothetical protein